jgi:hypothetical protein
VSNKKKIHETSAGTRNIEPEQGFDDVLPVFVRLHLVVCNIKIPSRGLSVVHAPTSADARLSISKYPSNWIYAITSHAHAAANALQPSSFLHFVGLHRALQGSTSGAAIGSPDFLHFVGLDRGRNPGWLSGVARATRRSTKTDSPSQSSNTLGDSKLARQPEMCHGQSNKTETLSSFCCPCVLSMSLYTEQVQRYDMQQYGKVVRLECSWARLKEQNEAFPTVPPSGQTDKWKALKPCVKAENVPKWAQCSQESIWESGWEVRDGAGKRLIECEMCTENDKEGRGWKRQWQ